MKKLLSISFLASKYFFLNHESEEQNEKWLGPILTWVVDTWSITMQSHDDIKRKPYFVNALQNK